MSECQCHRYVYQECEYFNQAVLASDTYKELHNKYETIKKLFRKANREINGYGKVQDDTRRELNKIARVKESPLS